MKLLTNYDVKSDFMPGGVTNLTFNTSIIVLPGNEVRLISKFVSGASAYEDI